MADIEVCNAEPHSGIVSTLHVRIRGVAPRTIDRATALAWLKEGHSLITYAGPAHHGTRGFAIERVVVEGEAYLRTDTLLEASDQLRFPHGH